MFAVKATYRGETRKFTFEAPSFPSYQELYTQLYRVFPIHNPYYLSKLMFSPTSSTAASRILIGKEAHSAEEYEKHIAPYQGRAWPNAVLRFSVFDENRHKAPNSIVSTSSTDVSMTAESTTASVDSGASMTSNTSSATVVPGVSEEDRFRRFTERKQVVERLREKMANRPRPESMDFMAAESIIAEGSRPSMHVPDDATSDAQGVYRPLPVLPKNNGNEKVASVKEASPPPQSAPVSESQSLGGRSRRLPAFLEPRPHSFVSSSPFGRPPLVVPPPPIIFSSSSKSSSPKRSPQASAQAAHDAVDLKQDLSEMKEMLVDILGRVKNSASASSSTTHSPAGPIPTVNIPVWPSCTRAPQVSETSYKPSYIVPPPPPIPTSIATPQTHSHITCDGCETKNIFGTRFKCLDCEDYDLCSVCVSSPTIRQTHDAGHCFWPIDKPDDKTAYEAARKSMLHSRGLEKQATTGEAHAYITCDVCRAHDFSGIRFKCLECDDYDMCEKCMWTSAGASSHPPHAFFPIEEPANFVAYGRARQQRDALMRRSCSSSPNVVSESSKIHNGITCDACQKRPITGVRFKCFQCTDYDLCRSCLSDPSVLEKHDVDHKFWPINEPDDLNTYRSVQSRLAEFQRPVHDYIYCDGCDATIVGVRHKCLDCDDYDLCTYCLSDPEQRSMHSLMHSFFPITVPEDKTGYYRVRDMRNTLPSIHPEPSQEAAEFPRVHDNVRCDACSSTIIGMRHKCLDCPDYDLCQNCVNVGAKEAHNPFHPFFEIEDPGDFVHTVFSGNGERVPSAARPETRPTPVVDEAPPAVPTADAARVAHNATCNLCDSRIHGDRFKCLNCPDFDTCESCFTITPVHHPGHGFVKVPNSDVLILRDTLRSGVAHPATCNNCDSLIRGTRYKCMHPSCPDYDLCQNCEAHPFPVHPDTHPMIKLKNIQTLIPTVVHATPVQAAVSTQTSTPVAMEVDATAGTVNELRQVFQTGAEGSSADWPRLEDLTVEATQRMTQPSGDLNLSRKQLDDARKGKAVADPMPTTIGTTSFAGANVDAVNRSAYRSLNVFPETEGQLKLCSHVDEILNKPADLATLTLLDTVQRDMENARNAAPKTADTSEVRDIFNAGSWLKDAAGISSDAFKWTSDGAGSSKDAHVLLDAAKRSEQQARSAYRDMSAVNPPTEGQLEFRHWIDKMTKSSEWPPRRYDERPVDVVQTTTDAGLLDARVLLETAQRTQENARRLYRAAADNGSNVAADNGSNVFDNVRTDAESSFNAHVLNHLRDTQRDLRHAYRSVALDGPSNDSIPLPTFPAAPKSKDARILDHFTAMPLRSINDEDMVVDNSDVKSINNGDDFIRRLQDMERKKTVAELTSETILNNCDAALSNARTSRVPAEPYRSIFDDSASEALPTSVPMNMDDHREFRRHYRSLFATDPAVQVTPEVHDASQAVVEEMKETRRQYGDLWVGAPSGTSDPIPAVMEHALASSSVVAERLGHTEATQPSSPIAAVPSIPPLVPTTWSPPRWHIETPPSAVVVPRILTPYRTSSYERRAVSPESVVEDSVMAQTVIPHVTLGEERLAASAIASSRLSPASVTRPLSPEQRLVDVDEPATEHMSEHTLDEAVTSAFDGLTTPSDVPGSNATRSPESIPKLGPVQNADWKELWPELTTMLKHLLQPPSAEASTSSTVMPGTMDDSKESKEVSSDEKEFHTAVEDSPLAQEALLTRPEGSSAPQNLRTESFSLKDYLTSLSPKPTYIATYVSDSNIQDGQFFPPGAEFVKSWRMRNDGNVTWPENTTLSFVAGDRIAPGNSASSVKIGSVAPGAEVEVVGPEMKAPDVPGKYVSYWRLFDGAGNYFGHSVWVDITVAEMNRPESKSSGEDSLASSSVIMPRPLESIAATANAPGSGSSITVLSNPPSDDGSFESSISLLDAPSSPSVEGDDAIYEDSRTNAAVNRPRDLEYVVLYDTSSSEED
ncbi:hypothetical protein EUX98_g2227 [Antrodiella citrinella]|uniref:ZZ-type domain-containing protein n=1 Tax=Antrodiella citrinella TaxID=2447956 RepID=A0A4S4MZH9_9APHY|nr:hypothetical protein EUX98_g2227 [Antrodiella citrinella]